MPVYSILPTHNIYMYYAHAYKICCCKKQQQQPQHSINTFYLLPKVSDIMTTHS